MECFDSANKIKLSFIRVMYGVMRCITFLHVKKLLFGLLIVSVGKENAKFLFGLPIVSLARFSHQGQTLYG